MALFDTDVLIDHLLNKTGATETMLKFKNNKNYCSVITVGEILFGMRKNEEEKTLKLLNNLIIIDVDKKIVYSAYEIKNNAKGFNLELYDCIIAATALEYDLILVTKNYKHYPDNRLKLFIPEY
ncbi:MAG: type II toxin-antitoxin system VapC family toxin [Actinobacteria bacterium]|nr:type II toxin-antitoxin system VapC family toxin [Cyanobacteriota bacterium]MCL6086939.1 type II toxin-antitoxin system VapC family toxin [Actinomycetota bacterium]